MITIQKYQLNAIAVNVLNSGMSERAIIFVHGNSSNAHSWDKQLADDKLNSSYRLIAFDLPGHGESSKSSDYSMKFLATLIRELVHALGIKEYILVGMSYGTCLIGEASPDLPGCRGIVLVSPNITSNEFHPGVWLNPFPEALAIASAMVDEQTLTNFSKKMVYQDLLLADNYAKSYKNTDPDFRLAVGQTIATAAWTDEINNLLQMKVPVCIVFGEHEQMIHTNYLDSFKARWRNKTFHIGNARHLVHLEQPEVFNSLLMEFAGDIFK